MTPEKLKVIAEGMGLNPRFTETNSGFALEAKVGSYGWIRYNPLTNDTQMVEIMEKLKIELCHTDHGWESSLYKDELPNIIVYGKTINEAVCNAAYEYFKEMK